LHTLSIVATNARTLPHWAPKIDSSRWVDNRVYTDPRVYEREVERIFNRTWLFAGHASEARAIGDYFTTTILGQPLLFVRGNDGAVRAFYNTCRHRGSKIASEPCGHASAFRCPYHFWVYDLDGKLIGIPGEEAYEGSGFTKEENPLVGLRCEEELGLLFVTFNEEAPSLREYLGANVIETLATPLANASFEIVKYISYELPVNWKVFAENARDGYHVPFVHPFFRKASPPGPYHLHDNGHAVQRLGMDPNGVEPELWAKIVQHTLPGVETGDGYIVTLFPDATITLRSNVISIDSQRALGTSAVLMESRVLGIVGDSQDVRDIRALGHATWFLNPVELEDAPIFVGQQEGVAARGVRYSVIARGADATTGTRGDDNRLRQWWTAWRQAMGVEINSLALELD
jgi:phenylpropionate dioxygenase-like ring-hydroxylating dioxygenase large terminal subunit